MRGYTMWALQESVGWQEFEDICTDYLFLSGHPGIRQAGRVGDGGRDAVVLHDRVENLVFAFSMEAEPLRGTSGKFHREYAKWQESRIRRFIFVSNRDLGAAKIDIPEQLNSPPAKMLDITDLVRFLDLTPDGRRIKANHGLDYEGAIQEETRQELQAGTEYTVMNLADLSHPGAKRYRADVLLNRQVSRERAKQILRTATETVRGSDYHRTEALRARWSDHDAHVVWLYLFLSYPDLERDNWVCRSQWVSDSLDGAFKPMAISAAEELEGIRVDWNEMHDEVAQRNASLTLDKEAYLGGMLELFDPAVKLMSTAAGLLAAYDAGDLGWRNLSEGMEPIEREVSELYVKLSDHGFPPPECGDLDGALERALTVAHDAVCPFKDLYGPRPAERIAVQTMRTALGQFPSHEQEVRSLLAQLRT